MGRGFTGHRAAGAEGAAFFGKTTTPEFGWKPVPAVRAAVEKAAQVFAERGALVEPADPFSQSPKEIFDTLARISHTGRF